MISVKVLDKRTIQIEFVHDAGHIELDEISTTNGLEIYRLNLDGKTARLHTSELDLKQNHTIEVRGRGKLPVDLAALLDPLASDKPLGCCLEGGNTVFRLFAPRAHWVALLLFERHDEEDGDSYAMQLLEDGVWERTVAGHHEGKYYGYKIAGPQGAFELFDPAKIIADPYSRAVVSNNSYLHESKSIICNKQKYNWQGDTFVNIAPEDLIIYEMHVRDMSVHPSAGVMAPGTYHGLVEAGTKGGINHILELGVNAVELLPCQAFGKLEVPFGAESGGKTNTWNPYARNHWGYMTSYFFAPEAYYASGGHLTPGGAIGIHGQQVAEFKDMVRALHQAGLAVILDVVYNHVSQYDLNPLKYADKQYYFRLDAELNLTEDATGCGNELKSERPMARRLIVESVKHWMQEYHIDGFRFDLAAALDWETIEQVAAEARKINPHVILIAEPWSLQRYDLAGFSDRGWMAWNDLFRNAIKGQNPHDGLGLIFGHTFAENGPEAIQCYVRGSTREYGGPFRSKTHSVNYLASHDEYTLGDFIRIGTGEVHPEDRIQDLEAHVTLSAQQMKLNKLAAVLLLTSQGAVMLHAGQEFARSKVIAPTWAPDPRVGQIDHNSYNKDNETNWLNFAHKEVNRELFEYYRGLIRLRRHPAFRRTDPGKITFLHAPVDHALGYLLPGDASGDEHDFIVLVNANPSQAAVFELQAGGWQKVVDGTNASGLHSQTAHGAIPVAAQSAIVLRRRGAGSV
ncbi:MAG: pullulanase [bacterium]